MSIAFRRARLVLAAAMTVVGLAALPGAPASAAPRPLVDYAGGATRGIGYRQAHRHLDAWIDVRLVGRAGSNAAVHGNRATFRAGDGITVDYETLPNGVKETIRLARPSQSTFRFAVTAPNVTLRQAADTIVAERDGAPVFEFQHPVAWDAHLARIPVAMRLDGGQVVLDVDPAMLARAAYPVTIDPSSLDACFSPGSGQTGACVVEGGIPGAVNATAGPSSRKLFRTADGRLVLFFKGPHPGDGAIRLAYSHYAVQASGSAAWTTTYLTDDDLDTTSDVTAVQRPDDSFVVAYTAARPGGTGIVVRDFTPTSSGWQAGATENALVIAGSPTTKLSLADYVVDATAGTRRTMIGFTANGLTGPSAWYPVIWSDDGGTWTTPAACDPTGQRGLVVAQPLPAGQGGPAARAVCVAVSSTGALVHRVQNAATGAWSAPVAVGGLTLDAAAELPSAVVTDDGAVHLAVSASDVDPQAAHIRLPIGGSAWDAVQALGPGRAPTISTTGTSLHVYAEDRLSAVESPVRAYTATDGTTWHQGQPESGGPFKTVYDFNAAWAFEDESAWGDALFALSDGSTTVGNRFGVQRTMHRIDSLAARVAYGFVLSNPTGADVSRVRVWADAVDSPQYRVGIQTDNGLGRPSGTWVNQVALGGTIVSGAFGIISPTTSGSHEVTFPTAHLLGSVRYHVVIEAAATPTAPDATHYAAFETGEAQPSALGSLVVATQTGATWTTQANQAPRFEVGHGSTAVVSQRIGGTGAGFTADEQSVPAESFTLSAALAPTSVTVYLRKTGNPTTKPKVSFLNSAGTTLATVTITSPQAGWVTVPVSGLSLAAGARYRMILDDAAPPSGNSWELGLSGDGAESWQGSASLAEWAPDRKGYNDRTGADGATGGATVFNGSSGDALYLGDATKFDRIAATLDDSSAIRSTAPSITYWNGSTWASLTTTANNLFTFDDTKAVFAPPANWATTSVNGRSGYWLRLAYATPAPGVVIDRITSYHDFSKPTTASTGVSYIPLAYSDADAAGLPALSTYDALVPAITSPTPAPTHNTTVRQPAVGATFRDAESGIDTGTARVALDGGAWRVVTPDSLGRAAYTPATNLSLGVHDATAKVVDKAGNAAATAWAFNTVTFAATNPSVATPSVSQPTNPNPIGTPPTTVTFSGVAATLGRQTFTLSSSNLWAGHGTVSRTTTLSDLKVTFRNETGTTADVAVPRAVTFSTRLGVLEKSSGAIEAFVEELSTPLGDITVTIPFGYATPGSTATLGPVTKTIEAYTSSADPFPTGFAAGTYTLNGGADASQAAPPVLETHVTRVGGQNAVLVVSNSPRLIYPCDGASVPCQAMRVLGSRVGAGPPSELSSLGPTNACQGGTVCDPLLSSPSDAYFAPTADATGSSFAVWQRVRAMGVKRSTDPDRVAMWQHALTGADACLSTRVLVNRATTAALGWAPSAEAGETPYDGTVDPSGGNSAQTLHVIGRAAGGGVELNSTFSGVVPTASGYDGGPIDVGTGWFNSWTKQAAVTDSPRVVTGSYFRGLGDIHVVSELSFVADFAPGSSPNCPAAG